MDVHSTQSLDIKEEVIDLLTMLTDAGMISLDQVREATERYLISSGEKRLDEVLVEIGAIKPDEKNELIEFIYGIPFIDLSKYICDLEAAKFIGREMAEEFKIIPLFKEDNELTVAVGKPNSLRDIEALQNSSGYNIRAVLADIEKIKESIPSYYEAAESVNKTIFEISKNTPNLIHESLLPTGGAIGSLNEALEEIDLSKELSKDASTIALINAILIMAVKNKATYLHIEPRTNSLKVRLRVRAKIQDVLDLPKNALPALVKRIKVMANLDNSRANSLQQGKIKISIKEKELELTVNIMPTLFGDRITFSGFSADEASVVFRSFNLAEKEILNLQEILSKPIGLVMFGGSEKAMKTALSAAIVHMNSADKNVIVFDDDPKEYEMQEVNLVKFSSSMGYSYSESLKHISNQDADILVVNRLSDPKTSSVAMQIAISRHLVLGIASGGNSYHILKELMKSGLDANLISLSLSGLVIQHWFKTLCPECKIKDKGALQSEEIKNFLGLSKNHHQKEFDDWYDDSKKSKEHLNLYKPSGCAKCKHTGFDGQEIITEIIPMTPRLRRAIVENSSEEEFEELLIKNDIKSLKRKVIKRVTEGVFDPRSSMDVLFYGLEE